MAAEGNAAPPLPEPAPPLVRTSMPYRRHHPRRRWVHKGWGWAAHLRRSLLVAILIVQTLFAVYYMLAILPYHGGTPLEIALAIAFAASFGWVSLGAWLALAGFFMRLTGGDRKGLLARTGLRKALRAPLAPTAILMPVYHESVSQSLAGLAAVYRSLERTGRLEYFEFFILSDSRDPDVWLAEEAGWAALVRTLNAEGRIHYRRRRINLKHKSGNIADFMRRWGKRFRYFMILDADSLMEGRTITRMVRLMQCHDHVGILQAPPIIIGARSPFARIQQFANRLYGPLFTTGLAAIQLGDGAYWGHNALIRTRPFIEHCAIANLRGIGLFRGAVLSHDFVEAAYMRRGGFEVWLEPAFKGSYEESPPSLVDELARDRRWARGNLQHIALMLGGRGLALAHRLTFLNGVLAYAAAPLWLAFLALSAAEVAQFTLFPINYFPGGHRLVPLWPEWHPEWAIRLVASTAFILFLPKVLSWLDALIRGTERRAFGGGPRLSLGVTLEALASVLLAPVRMLAHSRFVLEALLSLRLKWGGQNRGDELGWWTALRMHGFGMLLGVAWSWFAWWLKPLFLYWSLPVTLPLILAPIVSVLLSRHRAGDWLGRTGLLGTPADRRPPAVQRLRNEWSPDAAPPTGVDAFTHSLVDPDWNQVAQACASRRRAPEHLIEKALKNGPDVLSRTEKTLLADNRAALARLHHALHTKPSSQFWHAAQPLRTRSPND